MAQGEGGKEGKAAMEAVESAIVDLRGGMGKVRYGARVQGEVRREVIPSS
jgi:hypothetical protein